MILAVVNRCAGCRSVGRKMYLIGMSVRLRWQLHDDGIAGGVGE